MSHEWTDPAGRGFRLTDGELSSWNHWAPGMWDPAGNSYTPVEMNAHLKAEILRLRKQIERLTIGMAYCTCAGATTGSNWSDGTERCDCCGQQKQSEASA